MESFLPGNSYGARGKNLVYLRPYNTGRYFALEVGTGAPYTFSDVETGKFYKLIAIKKTQDLAVKKQFLGPATEELEKLGETFAKWTKHNKPKGYAEELDLQAEMDAMAAGGAVPPADEDESEEDENDGSMMAKMKNMMASLKDVLTMKTDLEAAIAKTNAERSAAEKLLKEQQEANRALQDLHHKAMEDVVKKATARPPKDTTGDDLKRGAALTPPKFEPSQSRDEYEKNKALAKRYIKKARDYGVSADDIAYKLVLECDSGIRRHLKRELEIHVDETGDKETYFFHQLDKIFLTENEKWASFNDFESFSMSKNETVTEFFTRFENAAARCRGRGNAVPDENLGLKALKALPFPEAWKTNFLDSAKDTAYDTIKTKICTNHGQKKLKQITDTGRDDVYFGKTPWKQPWKPNDRKGGKGGGKKGHGKGGGNFGKNNNKKVWQGRNADGQIQCSNCWNFGHSKRQCRAKTYYQGEHDAPPTTTPNGQEQQQQQQQQQQQPQQQGQQNPQTGNDNTKAYFTAENKNVWGSERCYFQKYTDPFSPDLYWLWWMIAIFLLPVTVAKLLWHFQYKKCFQKAAKNAVDAVRGKTRCFPCFPSGSIFFGEAENSNGKLLLDTGCIHSVCGRAWFTAFSGKKEEHVCERKEFSFGNEKSRFTTSIGIIHVTIGGKPVKIALYILDCDIPALLSVRSMRALGASINVVDNTVYFSDIGAHCALKESAAGHLYLDLKNNSLQCDDIHCWMP